MRCRGGGGGRSGKLVREGPFDAIHFNNLEGIPVALLGVAKRTVPDARVVVSLHNYFPFCPEVNLWFQNRANCTDYAGGKKCVNCRPASPPSAATRRRYLLQTLFRRIFGARSRRVNAVGRAALERVRPLVRRARRVAGAFRPATPPASPVLRILDRAKAEHYAARRAAFVDALNRDTDHVLAVSNRVADVVARLGVRRDTLATAYIGTRFARDPIGRRGPATGLCRSPTSATCGPIRGSTSCSSRSSGCRRSWRRD